MVDFKKKVQDHKALKEIFKKYMRTRDADKKHAKYSPSGMDRIMGCLGSVNACDGIPSKDNTFSILGTHTHTLMEFIFNHGETPLRHVAAGDFKKFISYTSEMHQAAMMAVKHAREVARKIEEKTGRAPTLMVEHKVRLQEIVNDDCGGTADIVLYQLFGVLHIMDYKNGTGTVEAEENKQLMTYALGVLHELGWDFTEVHITIIQPNGKHRAGPIRTWKTTIARLEEFEKELIRAVKLSKKKDAPLVIDSKWCYFCPANQANKCPAQRKIKKEKVMGRFQKPEEEKQNGKKENCKEENCKEEKGSWEKWEKEEWEKYRG